MYIWIDTKLRNFIIYRNIPAKHMQHTNDTTPMIIPIICVVIIKLYSVGLNVFVRFFVMLGFNVIMVEFILGDDVAIDEKLIVGKCEGNSVRCIVGVNVGGYVGKPDGVSVGFIFGVIVGYWVGTIVGVNV